LRDGKTETIADILKSHFPDLHGRMLVVGCGSGLEAAILSRELGMSTVGIDIAGNFDPTASTQVHFQVGDARHLEFADRSFDFVYSYHALEHIPSHEKALQEMRRVLRPGGGACVGTPNRLRLIGYLGSKDATFHQKVMWNFNDWTARLRGRFRNQYGAHAGFTAAELRQDLGCAFADITEITSEYYLRLYAKQRALVRAILAAGLGRFLFPSVYFIARR
jgi:ubiquinone/menaquinone biosynthesis C-methylase UbiE